MKKDQLKIIDPETREESLYNLNKEERLEIHLYYKMKVIEMERKQNTNPLEIAILDSCEFRRSTSNTFNQKEFLEKMAKKCKYKSQKLFSGLQKRRAQRKHAKIYFLKTRGISSI